MQAVERRESAISKRLIDRARKEKESIVYGSPKVKHNKLVNTPLQNCEPKVAHAEELESMPEPTALKITKGRKRGKFLDFPVNGDPELQRPVELSVVKQLEYAGISNVSQTEQN